MQDFVDLAELYARAALPTPQAKGQIHTQLPYTSCTHANHAQYGLSNCQHPAEALPVHIYCIVCQT